MVRGPPEKVRAGLCGRRGHALDDGAGLRATADGHRRGGAPHGEQDGVEVVHDQARDRPAPRVAEVHPGHIDPVEELHEPHGQARALAELAELLTVDQARAHDRLELVRALGERHLRGLRPAAEVVQAVDARPDRRRVARIAAVGGLGVLGEKGRQTDS